MGAGGSTLFKAWRGAQPMSVLHFGHRAKQLVLMQTMMVFMRALMVVVAAVMVTLMMLV